MQLNARDVYAALLNRPYDDNSTCVRIAADELNALIADRLRTLYPCVHFELEDDHRGLHVAWTDGPAENEIRAIVASYGFRVAPGAAFPVQADRINYLLPNGQMTPAATIPVNNDGQLCGPVLVECQPDDAIMVKGPNRNLITHRRARQD